MKKTFNIWILFVSIFIILPVFDAKQVGLTYLLFLTIYLQKKVLMALQVQQMISYALVQVMLTEPTKGQAVKTLQPMSVCSLKYGQLRLISGDIIGKSQTPELDLLWTMLTLEMDLTFFRTLLWLLRKQKLTPWLEVAQRLGTGEGDGTPKWNLRQCDMILPLSLNPQLYFFSEMVYLGQGQCGLGKRKTTGSPIKGHVKRKRERQRGQTYTFDKLIRDGHGICS